MSLVGPFLSPDELDMKEMMMQEHGCHNVMLTTANRGLLRQCSLDTMSKPGANLSFTSSEKHNKA